jgi:hypothetical protein
MRLRSARAIYEDERGVDAGTLVQCIKGEIAGETDDKQNKSPC